MQSKWTWKSYKGQFFVFSSSLQLASQAARRWAWRRSLRVLLDWENLLNWSNPSLNFSHPLSTLFQGQWFNFYIPSGLLSFNLGWSSNPLWHPPTRTWTGPWTGKSLKSSRDGLGCGGSFETTCWLLWTRVVEDKRSAFHPHGPRMTWRGVYKVYPSCHQHVSQVFLQARGDHPSHPEFFLPQRSSVPCLESRGLVWFFWYLNTFMLFVHGSF